MTKPSREKFISDFIALCELHEIGQDTVDWDELNSILNELDSLGEELDNDSESVFK